MSKRSFSLAVVVGMIFLCLSSQRIQAQSDTPKFELGVHFPVTGFGGFAVGGNDETDRGIGGRVTWNLNRWIAVEGELNTFLPASRYSASATGTSTFIFSVTGGPSFPITRTITQTFTSSRRIEGLFGPKIGWRWRRFGVFGKAKAGFFQYDQDTRLSSTLNPPVVPDTFNSRQRNSAGFARDLGCVVEFYPSRRIVLRVDIGDTLIRFGARDLNFDGSVSGPSFGERTKHYLQINTGIGFRF
jgi:hypothetical protein